VNAYIAHYHFEEISSALEADFNVMCYINSRFTNVLTYLWAGDVLMSWHDDVFRHNALLCWCL